MTTAVVLTVLALVALGYWPIGPWVRRRNARIVGAHGGLSERERRKLLREQRPEQQEAA